MGEAYRELQRSTQSIEQIEMALADPESHGASVLCSETTDPLLGLGCAADGDEERYGTGRARGWCVG